MPKEIKGEKYIYLLMGYTLANQSGGAAIVGEDNEMIGGQHYYRTFSVQKYDGKTLLVERKSSKHLADFSRVFEVIGDKPTIREYIDEAGDNCSKTWTH